MAIELELAVAAVVLSQPPKHVPAKGKGKGKAKAMEETNDEDEDEVTRKLWQELEDFVVSTTFDNKQLAKLLPPSKYFEKNVGLLCTKISGGRKTDLTLVVPATQVLVLQKNGTNGIGIRVQKKCPPVETLKLTKCVKLVQAAKAFLEQQDKLSGLFVLEEFKSKGKSKAIAMEKTGAKCTYKLKKTIDSNSNKEEEEERTCVIKKIKHEHIKEPIEKGKGNRRDTGSGGAKGTLFISAGMPKPVAKASITLFTVLVTPMAKPVMPVKAPTSTVALTTKPAA
ncbi:hypothetical protein C0995_016672 [Termitomyces sp. Mi166|nr:hypothetical protein C0995_016672 [Termitomyces sp. Mi166\